MQVTGIASSPRPGSAERASCDEQEDISVRVALRARPLVRRERLEGAKTCVEVDEAAGAVVFGSQRRFTFDHVFGPNSTQDQVYETCVSDLVDAVVEGYNATVLAYGPTGSGKTYTMGTGSALHCMPEQQGIIPRVIRRLFEVIQSSSSDRSFIVRAQFLEIYNEELRDLLAPAGSHTSSNGGAVPFSSSSNNTFSSSRSETSSAGGYGTPTGHRSSVAIRECPNGQIVVTGAREEIASSYEDLAHFLDCGALARATGATALNEQSSRSHAIFTIIVEQSIRVRREQHYEAGQEARDSSDTQRPASRNSCSSPMTPRARLLQQLNQSSGAATPLRDSAEAGYTRGGSHSPSSTSSSKEAAADGMWGTDCSTDGSLQMEYRCAKFHLVDLAGSERTKRSGAVGARFKETVTINQGLLALGNVISALGDDKRRLPGRHVPYRDSKLTRLLQDSLGGNSKTLMVACISSADDVLEENLNTLKYASRARHIRNRPIVNCQKLGSSSSGIAGDVQALQLLLLRRFTHQVLGPLTSCAVPDQLLADVSRCGEAASARLLRELQLLAAVPKATLAAGLAHDIQLRDQEHQQDSKQLSRLQQQLSDLESQLSTARMQAAAFEMQADFAAEERVAAEQTVAEAVLQQEAVQHELLMQIDKLQETGRIGPAVRNQLSQLVLKLLKPLDTSRSASNPAVAAAKHALRESVQSHPLPILDVSCCDETIIDAIRAAKVGHAGSQSSSCGGQQTQASRQVDQLKQQLAEATAELQAAQQDLARDEEIFAQRVMEMAKLRDDMAAMASAAQQERAAAAAQIQHLQADLRRWRTRALALQGCATVDIAASGVSQPHQGTAPPPGRTNSDGHQPSSPDSLVGELSFAAFAGQHQHAGQQQQQQVVPTQCIEAGAGSSGSIQGAAAAGVDAAKISGGFKSAANSSIKVCQDHDHEGVQGFDRDLNHDLIEDDQVLFDDDLASYISDTDYTDLRSEESQHLMAELQAVLADKAALEDEKAAAQAEAAAAQQSFERSRALLESQLTRLSSAISSQETLITTLQSNEAEARQLGALYLDRCRELEVELAELQLDLEELTAALAQVEADAAASAEEKQRLRTEYERKISAVVEQMSGLQRQLKGQDLSRVERERQRAAQQVQQLQTSLTALRAEQEALRKRLQERLLAQEKAAADKAKELAALRRAADAAKKRVTELEQQNKRQQAELRAKAIEADVAQKQLRQLESQGSLGRSKPACSPRASPRANPSAQSPRSPRRTSSSGSAGLCDPASVANNRDVVVDRARSGAVGTPSGKIFKHGMGGRKPSTARQLSPRVPVAAAAGNGIARQVTGEANDAAVLDLQAAECEQQQQHGAPVQEQDCVQLTLPGSKARGSHAPQQAIYCADNDGMPAVGSRGDHQLQHHHEQAATAASGSSITSSIASLAGNSKIRSWLKSQLQLLAVKWTAEAELQRLQARYDAAVHQREHLQAAKAVLDLKELRKDSAAVQGDCHGSSSSSSGRDHSQQPIEVQCEQQHSTGIKTATTSKLPEGLSDQLDAAEAQLQHLKHQMQQQKAQSAAVHEATAQLRAQVRHMSVQELGVLLEQALDVLDEQARLHQAEAAKANSLELDLQQQQQELEEVTSRLHSTQLQHQTQITDLQQQHEQRLMELLKQSTTAAAVAAAETSNGAGMVLKQFNKQPGVVESGVPAPQAERLQPLTGAAATAAALVAGKGVMGTTQQYRGPQQQQNDASKAADTTATAVDVDAAGCRASSRDSTESPAQHAAAPAVTSIELQNTPAAAQRPAAAACNQALFPMHSATQQQQTTASPAQRRSSTDEARTPAAAGVEVLDPIQWRLSPRQGSPTRGPQLSDLMACLAQRPNSRQQQQQQGRQHLARSYMQLLGWNDSQQQHQQQQGLRPGNSSSSNSSVVAVSTVQGTSGSSNLGLQQQQQRQHSTGLQQQHSLCHPPPPQQQQQKRNSGPQQRQQQPHNQGPQQQQQQQHNLGLPSPPRQQHNLGPPPPPQQHSPTRSAESSPSKLQAKLAAYRSHLKSASCNTSPQKLLSSSSPVGLIQSATGRTAPHGSPTRLHMLHSQQQTNGGATSSSPVSLIQSVAGHTAPHGSPTRLHLLHSQQQTCTDGNGSSRSSSPSGEWRFSSSSKRQSGEMRALASYTNFAQDQKANVHDQVSIGRPGSTASQTGDKSARVQGSSSAVDSSVVSSSKTRMTSSYLVSSSLVSNSSMIGAGREAAADSSTTLGHNGSSSSRGAKEPHTSSLAVDLDSPPRQAAVADERVESGALGVCGSLDLSAAKLAAAAAALLRDAGLDPDADAYNQSTQ